MNQENVPGAVPALVLGILGIVLCPLTAPFAFVQGRRAEKVDTMNPGRYSGRGMATAGKILGIIGMVLLVLAVLFIIVFVILGVAISNTEIDPSTFPAPQD